MTTPDRPAPDVRVWSAVLAHRDRAVRVALARCGSRADVDDVVQEAMLRVAAMPGLDVDRIGPLITVVVSNLATDARRRGASRAVAEIRLRHASAHVPPHDDDVCDAHEARWLRSRMQGLPAQDRRALELRATGLNVGEIAHALGVTYKAAENALGRARTGMRDVWRATAALVAVLSGLRRRSAPAAAVPAAVAAALVATGLSVCYTPLVLPSPEVQARSSYQTALPSAAASVAPAVAVKHAAARVEHHPPAPAATRAAPGQLRPVPAVRAGKLQYGGVVVKDRPHHEDAVQTVGRCLRHATVSLTHVECDG